MSLREAFPGDVRQLADAERVCFTDAWPSQFFVSEILAPGRYQRLAVDPAGRLTGYLFAAWQYLDLHVLKVATLPEYRRQGLGRRLMVLAEEHTLQMGGESVTLEVRFGNTAAIQMYRSLAYHEVGLRPRYYADGEDALIMTKTMRES